LLYGFCVELCGNCHVLLIRKLGNWKMRQFKTLSNFLIVSFSNSFLAPIEAKILFEACKAKKDCSGKRETAPEKNTENAEIYFGTFFGKPGYKSK